MFLVLEVFDDFVGLVKHFLNTNADERKRIRKIEHDEYIESCKRLAVDRGRSKAEFVFDGKLDD